MSKKQKTTLKNKRNRKKRLKRFDDIRVGESRNIMGYDFYRLSWGCPDQIYVYLDGVEVAYIRHRSYKIRATDSISGEIIFYELPERDEALCGEENNGREKYFKKVINHLNDKGYLKKINNNWEKNVFL